MGDAGNNEFLWTVAEASTKQVTQIGASACGATAVINTLKVLKIHKDQDEIASAVSTRLRANNAPLPEYLFSRSVAGVSHTDIIKGLEKASQGSVFARFFHFYPQQRIDLLKWLGRWLKLGVVPIATLNLQRVSSSAIAIPDAWHHQMIYGISEEGVHMCNPLTVETVPSFMNYISSDSVLKIRRVDVISRWQKDVNLSVLSQHSDPRWREMDVEGEYMYIGLEQPQTKLSHTMDQVKKMLGEPEPYSQSPETRPPGVLADWLFNSHICIPALYKSGITLCVRKDNKTAYRLLTEEPQLPLS